MKNIILNPKVQYYKFPLLMFVHYIMKEEDLKKFFTYEDLKKFISNYYAYAFFFISNGKNKNKSSIDQTIFTELYKFDNGIAPNEVIHGIIKATQNLRKAYLDEYVQFNTFSSEKAYALYSVMDNYVARTNYIGEIYCLPEYNAEHLIVHDNSKMTIMWAEVDNEFSFSLKELIGSCDNKTYKTTKYKKTMANYLILPSKLNENLGKQDIVEKIKMIRGYYLQHQKDVPKHVETILSHIEHLPEYNFLKDLKGRRKTKNEIMDKYKSFVNAYFNEENQHILYEELQKALKSSFENN